MNCYKRNAIPYQFIAIAVCAAMAATVAAPYASAQGSWMTAAPMPTRRSDLAVVTGQDGRIYALNGRIAAGSPSIAFRLTEIFDPATNSWTTGTPPLGGHYGGRAVLGHDGLIYFIGGYYRDTFVEAYDPMTATWSPRASMPTGRFGFAAVTGADGRIYTFGGDTSGGGENTNVAEVYDPVANTWSSLTAMPMVRAGFGAVLGPDGRIYLIGGHSYNLPAQPLEYVTTVNVYDPVSDSWSTAASLPGAQDSPAVVGGADGKLYAIGGYSGASVLNIVEAYDLSSNSWSTMAPMPTARFVFDAARSLDGRIFAMGGVDASLNSGITTNEAFSPASFVIAALYDQTRAVKSGSTIPIKIRLLDANGANVSSSAIAVHGVSVTAVSANSPGTLEDSGNANPDSDFRYDVTLGGYIFNLSTKGFSTGTYNMNFRVANDAALHSVQFQVK